MNTDCPDYLDQDTASPFFHESNRERCGTAISPLAYYKPVPEHEAKARRQYLEAFLDAILERRKYSLVKIA